MPTIIVCSSVDGELIRYSASCLNGNNDVKVFVTVSESAYRAKARRGGWARLHLRVLMYLWHPIRLSCKLLTEPRGSVFLVTTNPFYAPSLAAVVAKVKRQKVVQILYDLFPDALEEAGLIRADGLQARILGLLTSCALRNAAHTVFLGDKLKATTESRWGIAKSGSVIPVVMSRPIAAIPEEALSDQVEIHYGGQMGWMHDASMLADLMDDFFEVGDATLSEKMHWSFLISGAKAAAFSERLKARPVEFGAPLPVVEWRQRALQAQVGLVSLSPGGARVCLPSKTYGMMACGMAILALCPLESDLGRMISEKELGWVVDNSQGGSAFEDIKLAFAATLHSIVEDPREVLRRRRNAWNYVRDQNRLDHEESRWKEALSDVIVKS